MLAAISHLFTIILYQPLYNALIFVYNIIPDLGVSIIVITVIIRLVLLPVSKKAIESQKKMQDIQPQLKEIQEKYKGNQQKKSEEMMKLYKEKKINPAAGCLPMIVQLVILIALYRVFLNTSMHFDNGSTLLYSFISSPETINPISFGIIDITKRSIPLAVIAAGFQFWQTKMMMAKQKAQKKPAPKKDSKDPDFGTIMQQQMLYIAPIMTFVIGLSFPAALPIYWIVTTLFMIAQQYYVIKEEFSDSSTDKQVSAK